MLGRELKENFVREPDQNKQNVRQFSLVKQHSSDSWDPTRRLNAERKLESAAASAALWWLGWTVRHLYKILPQPAQERSKQKVFESGNRPMA